jgi:hypothetical protein
MGEAEDREVERTLKDIVQSSLSERKDIDDETKDLILLLTEEGSLEQHQTKGTIERWTKQLLTTLRKELTYET